MIGKWLNGAVKGWNEFWFETEYGAQMTLFRVGLAGLLLFYELTRLPDLNFFYSESGIVPLSVYQEFMEAPYKLTVLAYTHSQAALWGCFSLELLALGALMLGILPRISAIVAMILHVSFMHRNVGLNYGVDNISTFLLFYLCLADYRVKPVRGLRSMLGSVALRLVQIQICIVYVYAGLDKIRGQVWWSGDALWYALGNQQRCPWDLSFLAHFPIIVAFSTYATLVFETYFPLLVVSRQTRPLALWVGLFLHIGIAISMNLFTFSALMAMTYLTFLDAELCQALLARAKKPFARAKVPIASAEENYV